MQVELHDCFALNLGILFLLPFALSAFTTDFDVDTCREKAKDILAIHISKSMSVHLAQFTKSHQVPSFQ